MNGDPYDKERSVRAATEGAGFADLITPGDVVMINPPARDGSGPINRLVPAIAVDVRPPGNNGTIMFAPAARTHVDGSPKIGQVLVDDAEGMNRAGLNRPTAFDFAKMTAVNDDPRHIVNTKGVPRIIGHLTRKDTVLAKRAHARAARRFPDVPTVPGFGAHTPKPGDVAFINVPYEEDPDVPGGIPHPALVTRVSKPADRTEAPTVTLAPGTSSKLHTATANDVVIQDEDSHFSAGLNKPTRFQLDKQFRIPWEAPWLHHTTPDGPTVGRLRQADLRRAARVFTETEVEPRVVDRNELHRRLARDNRTRSAASRSKRSGREA